MLAEYRTRFSGHKVGLCGLPALGANPSGTLTMGAAVSVFLDEPFGVVALCEESDGLSDLIDGFEDAAMDDLPLERPEQAFDDAVGLGLANEVIWPRFPWTPICPMETGARSAFAGGRL